MKERGILFSGAMVRAILRRTKAVTRRVVRDVPEWVVSTGPDRFGAVLYSANADRIEYARCPYGVSGDRLWVRETWRPDHSHDPDDTRYRADYLGADYDDVRDLYPWRPSIFMPRVRSRVTLDVVSVRVERLHAIDFDDAGREGIADYLSEAHGILPSTEENDDAWRNRARVENFALLWDSINGKRAPWADNPWVWRVEFKPVEVSR